MMFNQMSRNGSLRRVRKFWVSAKVGIMMAERGGEKTGRPLQEAAFTVMLVRSGGIPRSMSVQLKRDQDDGRKCTRRDHCGQIR